MKRLIKTIVYGITRILLSLRYRFEIVGLEKIDSSKGIIFLPNHPAEVDPIMLMYFLGEKFKPRPLVVEHFYYLKGVEWFLDLVGAIPIPNINGTTNQWLVKQVEKTRKQIQEDLKKGDNFLIYPSGRLKLTKDEVIGGASFIHNLVSESPEAKVVLIKTSGLWGSLFSRAITGQVPDFASVIKKGFKIILKNLIFFAPRRTVRIEFTPAPPDFPYGKPRIEFNRYLENWYNTPPDDLKLVSFYFWKHEVPEVVSEKEKSETTYVDIPKEIETSVIAQIAKLAKRKPEEIKKDMHLAYDLGLDSLDMAELGIYLDEQFDIRNLSPSQVQTVHDALAAAAGFIKTEEKEKQPPEKLKNWLHEKEREGVLPPLGNNIQEAFLLSCERMGNANACTDDVVGPLTYKELKRNALILSQKIQKMPGKNIGILMPSTVGAYVVILATMLAKKTPVMLNWTAGSRSLDHSVTLTELQVVLSSYRFLSQIENADLGIVEDRLVFLENVRRKLTLMDKIKGILLSHKKLNFSDIKEDDTAVILFTSGTETLPKGVPLSHYNILSNQRAALSCVNFSHTDTLFGMLPPFHSFGFSITGLLALLIGMKAVYAPNPTDPHALVYDIDTWKPTILCGAPGFINAIFRVAHNDQLRSLRLVVSGADKTPQELFDKSHQLGAEIIEGYGITECSPVVTMDRLDRPHKGVGQPLPGIELCIIDPETKEIVNEGEICIHGPNVFKGYIGYDKNPFIQINGKRFFRSGDQGSLDPDGTLMLSGRLKRFVKIGGEMVSLGGLENDLLDLVKEKNWQIQNEGPSLAITSFQREGDKTEIILFTTFDVSKEEINTALQEKGHGRIVKISNVQKIDQIPLTGTGKTHYRLLDEICQKNQSL